MAQRAARFEALATLVGSITAEKVVPAAAQAFGSESDVLDVIFEQYRRNFVPEATQGVGVRFQFLIGTSDGAVPYMVVVDDGTCRIGCGRLDRPTATMRMELADFIQLTFGRTSGAALVASGRLDVTGDMFATMNFSDWFVSAQD